MRVLKLLLFLVAVVALVSIPIAPTHTPQAGGYVLTQTRLAQTPVPDPGDTVLPGWATVLVMVTGFVWPFIFRSAIGPKLKKLIPVVNVVLAVLINLVTAFVQAGGAATSVQPASFTLASTGLMYAGFFGTVKNVFLNALIQGLIQGLAPTAVHSAVKNAAQTRRL